MGKRTYCCDLMTRWVSNPLGANAPPEPKLIVEYDMPEMSRSRMTDLNTPLNNNADVLIHHDSYDDFGILAHGEWAGHYVGIAFCPWCGTDLDSSPDTVGKMMVEIAGQFTDFDDREQSLTQVRREHDFDSDFLEEMGIAYTEDMSDIEILIRLQGKYQEFIFQRYSDSPGRLALDFDKEWPPKELAVIAQFCAENGQRDPDLALWKLLCIAEQPAVWALAMLDLAANDIPKLLNIYFELRPDDQPAIVIQFAPVKSARSLMALGNEMRGLMSKIEGYDISAGEESTIQKELDNDIKAYTKLMAITGYLADASNIEDGVLRYEVAPYFRDDVLRFMKEKRLMKKRRR